MDSNEDVKKRAKKGIKRRKKPEADGDGQTVECEKAVEKPTKRKKKRINADYSGSANVPDKSKKTEANANAGKGKTGDPWKKTERNGGAFAVDRQQVEHIVTECESKGFNRDDTKVVIKKWKRSEQRRLRRQKERHSTKVCFNCRKPGHQLAECPEVLGAREFAVGVCFKCGSTEHAVAQCRLKIKSFPYAKCFVCGETGHLSRNCEQNPNGAFPQGGSCKSCGALDHLRKDCPVNAAESENRSTVCVIKEASGHMSNPDEDIGFDMDARGSAADKAKKTKVVRF